MNRLVAAALLVVLAGVPSIAAAESSRAAPSAMGAVAGWPGAPHVAGSPADATNYAAREAAAPALGEFAGGGGGIYIGSSAVVIILLVIIIVILV